MTVANAQDAQTILEGVGMPRGQLNERSGLVLLALLDLGPGKQWSQATAPMRGITPIMDWIAANYEKNYAPNTRETVRRQTMHQFVDGGLALRNPDDPGRPTNSPHTCYQAVPEFLDLVKQWGTPGWDAALAGFVAERETLAQRYARARDLEQVPVVIPGGGEVLLSPGAHSQLIKAVIEIFGAQFTRQSRLLYAGDTGAKLGVYQREELEALGVVVDEHGKMPDVVIHDTERNWLLLCEAVTSHGPVDGKRRGELAALFANATAGLVYVSAFPDRATFRKYTADIAWETEAWVATDPTHMVHFNGERFLGPYEQPDE